MCCWTLPVGMLLALATAAGATTYVIHPDGSGDFPMIQAAVDAAVDGDIIELTDGTFTGNGNYNIDFLGKAITVRSQSGNPESVRILCDELSRGFIFQSSEGSASVIEGVKIAGGYAHGPYAGGGVFCGPGSAPRIVGCIFDHDMAEGSGGGIACRGASPTVIDCFFDTCFAFHNGGAILCDGGSFPTITGCTFQHNHAQYEGGSGGAISCRPEGHATITDCCFVGNRAPTGGGGAVCGSAIITNCEFAGNSAWLAGAVYCGDTSIIGCVFRHNSADFGGGAIGCYSGADALLRNCTLYDSRAEYWGSGLYCHDASSAALENCIVAFGTGDVAVDCGDDAAVLLTCCDIYGNAEGDWVGCIEDQLGIDGNICEDPLFCDQYTCPPDLTLQECSPCRPFSPPNPECDLIGALAVGCGGTPVTESTWGALKSLFRQ
jgi:hypothetical protein